MIMTSVKLQFVATKLCALLKKPPFDGMLIAIRLTKSKMYAYGIIGVVFFARKPT
jgi:hypothetical protein